MQELLAHLSKAKDTAQEELSRLDKEIHSLDERKAMLQKRYNNRLDFLKQLERVLEVFAQVEER